MLAIIASLKWTVISRNSWMLAMSETWSSCWLQFRPNRWSWVLCFFSWADQQKLNFATPKHLSNLDQVLAFLAIFKSKRNASSLGDFRSRAELLRDELNGEGSVIVVVGRLVDRKTLFKQQRFPKVPVSHIIHCLNFVLHLLWSISVALFQQSLSQTASSWRCWSTTKSVKEITRKNPNQFSCLFWLSSA
jgi:hypothetical protein